MLVSFTVLSFMRSHLSVFGVKDCTFRFLFKMDVPMKKSSRLFPNFPLLDLEYLFY